MFANLVSKGLYCFNEGFDNWQDSIKASCKPLLEKGIIENSYVQLIIDCVNKYGPYIVLAPNIAMPHSTEGAVGVNGTEISFMRVQNPVHFENGNADKDAKIFFVLASINHEKHMEQMVQLATILSNNDLVNALINATTKEDLLAIDRDFNLN